MNKLKTLFQRSISGLIFIAIVISSILLDPYAFLGVFLLITLLGIYEFHKMTNVKSEIEVNLFAALTSGAIFFLSSFFYAKGEVPLFIFSIYALWIIAIFIIELFRKKTRPIHNWSYFFFGQIYIVLPFSLLNFILFISNWQPWILLSLFIVIWVNDTGAYLTGMSLGKHKLFERISPKKTWEGFFGGVAFGLIAGYVLSRFITDISLVQWLIFSVLVTVFGTLGDLSESLIKRSVQMKDSGNIIPGHGGILDRFDSTILTSPILFIYLYYILVF